MKAILLIIIMTALGSAVEGRDTNDYSTATGKMVDDIALTANVKAALLNEPEVNNADIIVETVTGTVTLSGWVSSDEQSHRGVDIVRAVGGVQTVQN